MELAHLAIPDEVGEVSGSAVGGLRSVTEECQKAMSITAAR